MHINSYEIVVWKTYIFNYYIWFEFQMPIFVFIIIIIITIIIYEAWSSI